MRLNRWRSHLPLWRQCRASEAKDADAWPAWRGHCLNFAEAHPVHALRRKSTQELKLKDSALSASLSLPCLAEASPFPYQLSIPGRSW